MRWWLVKARKLGGHWHTRWFAASRSDGTYAGLGGLTMDETDWSDFCELVRGLPRFRIEVEG